MISLVATRKLMTNNLISQRRRSAVNLAVAVSKRSNDSFNAATAV
jgi:hypothetical protein